MDYLNSFSPKKFLVGINEIQLIIVLLIYLVPLIVLLAKLILYV